MKNMSPAVKIDISRVSELANIPLSDKEKTKLEQELTQTLDYIADLNTIDTKNVEPTSQVTGLTNILREDIAAPSLTQEHALQNTKAIYNGFFKVKAILESE
jgi:aspartyl-tRNA(Asn)/glutamyl-tRNA(Gln) amidotransferase subunit C